MSKATHTPGPWEVGTIEFDIQTETDDLVAQAEASNPNWRANARLIAAAPDLLAILTRIIHRATGPMSDGDIDFEDVKTAYAAIAKATGEQS